MYNKLPNLSSGVPILAFLPQSCALQYHYIVRFQIQRISREWTQMSNLIQFLWLSVYRIKARTATVLNSTFTFHLMDFSISSSYLRPHNFVIFSPVSLSTRYLSYRSLPVPTLLNSFISFPLCDDSLSLQSSFVLLYKMASFLFYLYKC